MLTKRKAQAISPGPSFVSDPRSTGAEVEGVGHDYVAAPARFGELPTLDRLGDAASNVLVLHRGLLDNGRADLTGTGDDEVDCHATLKVGVLSQTLVVARTNFVDMRAHDSNE